ncbi:hypothetical protein [Taibaiella koreensis]|uniref:hypothetical protein n=1 Tax=Taibaiella koreensis TaxID=1268548 RepID=UPI0013C305C9|nr:hypothetical protein [Taibaiella koreensis]
MIMLLCYGVLSYAGKADSVFSAGLLARVKQYDLEKGNQGLYLHTDKTVYTHREFIWFTAYQLTDADSTANTLFVSLQKAGEDTAAEINRFILKDGLARGAIYLSDSLKDGDYRLLAFSNIQLDHPGKPVFQQTIRLVSTFGRKYSLLKLPMERSDTAKIAMDVRYKVILDDGASADKGNVSYALFSGKCLVSEGREKLNGAGEFRVPLPPNYGDTTLRLQVLLHHGYDRERFSLPVKVSGCRIKFYPESGHLLDGVPCSVAFEVKGNEGKLLSGSLRENGKIVARLQPDKRGRGIFRFTPLAGRRYIVDINDGRLASYSFPEVEVKGMVLSVDRDVVENDVDVTISSSDMENACYLVVHNYKEVFNVRKYNFREAKAKVHIPLGNVEGKGVLTLTLLDTSMQPLAERCIFRRDSGQVLASLNTDLREYGTRQKVRLRITLRDQRGNAVKGLFSIGCVAMRDRDSNSIVSLPAFWYAGQYLPVSTNVLAGFNMSDTADISLMLQTVFWTRYRWGEMMKPRPLPVPAASLSERIPAQIFYKNKPLQCPIDYAIITDDGWKPFATDSFGNFAIRWNSLYAPANGKVGIIPMVTKGSKYEDIHQFRLGLDWGRVTVVMDGSLSGNAFPEIAEAYEESYTLKAKHLLKEVYIKGKSSRQEQKVFVSKNCRDYVCIFNVLNCINHSAGTKPVEGQVYWYYTDASNLTEVIYRGCEDTSTTRFLYYLNGTWQSKEFYVVDFDRDNISGQEKTSTLFWSHEVHTNAEGEAELSFFTNDLVGHFILHLQGVSSGGPLSGVTTFRVKSASP